jgi:hypothetical protein
MFGPHVMRLRTHKNLNAKFRLVQSWSACFSEFFVFSGSLAAGAMALAI